VSTPIPNNRAPFSVGEILASTGGTLYRLARSEAVGVGTDTRQDLADKLFVTLSGPNFDGHAFLEQAVARGAAMLVVATGRGAAAPAGVTVIEVPEPLTALGALAAFHRRRFGGRVVAVAGSAGKTSTRSTIGRLLEALFPGQVHTTVGNLNNRIGVPLTLLGLEPHHQLAVVEVGTNCPGEVLDLGRMVAPDVAVLTLIDLEHTEGLADLEGVAREEGALFETLAGLGVAIGNVDDPLVRQRLEHYAGRRLGYGESPDADLRIASRRLLSPKLTQLDLCSKERTWSFETSLFGTPGALAVAAAALVCEELAPGRLLSAHLEAALNAGAEPGRNSVQVLNQGRVLLDDTYNSNPASARQAIFTGEELARLTGGRLWLVLGEMRELGALSVGQHQTLGQVAAASSAAGLFAIGEQAEPMMTAARAGGLAAWHDVDAGAVGSQLWGRLLPGDVIVVKASRGVRAERVVQYLLEADQQTSAGELAAGRSLSQEAKP